MTNMCFQTGETTETLVCPTHGAQNADHFEILAENPKQCSICNDNFFAIDENRTTCAKDVCNS